MKTSGNIKDVLIAVEKFMYTREDIIMPIIMDCRVSTPEAMEFISKLGFNQHDIKMIKEQSVLTKIIKIFPSGKILLQHSVFEL